MDSRLEDKLKKAEGRLCGLVLNNPEILNDYKINKKLLSSEGLFYIGVTEKMLIKGIEVIDELSFISEIENFKPLVEKYNEMGAWTTVKELMAIVDVNNAEAIYDDFSKWNLVKKYIDKGILDLDQHFDKVVRMKASQVEDYMTAVINDVALDIGTTGSSVSVIDLTTGYDKFIKEWNSGSAIGYKLGFPILNYITCGLHRGTLSFLSAHSGNGKTSFAIPMAILPVIESGDKVVIIANEQDEDSWRQMILATVLFNKVKYKGMNRQKLLYGNFSNDDLSHMKEAVEWLNKHEKQLQFVHLTDYGIENMRRVIKKYSKMGYSTIIIDTLKPEDDASDKAWGAFSETAKELFVLAQQCNVAMLCTAQLATNSYGRKFLDTSSIGKSKAIVEVAAQVFMFRSVQKQEKKDLKVWRHKRDSKTNKLTNVKETVPLDENKDYIVLFITKNRYGESNVQLVYERNMAFNTYYELGYTSIEYDGFGR